MKPIQSKQTITKQQVLKNKPDHQVPNQLKQGLKSDSSNEKLLWQNQELALTRYPQQHRKELRAWDSADVYLLDTVMKLNVDQDKLGILHDSFGALSTALADYNPIVYTDSWMSKRAIELNLEQNQICSQLRLKTELEQLGTQISSCSLVIGKIPKQNSQLIALLQILRTNLKPSTPLLLAGMDKHLSRSQYDLLAEYFGPSEFLPGVKKARIWRAYCQAEKSQAEIKLESTKSNVTSSRSFWGKEIKLDNYQLKLRALPQVFSRDKLDMGSRFLLEHLKHLPAKKRVTDLACGYGILGLAYLRLHPSAELTFCDESFQAVSSTKYNLAHNIPKLQSESQVSVYADDGLKNMRAQSQELIICNPPFHQQHTVSTDIANSLFSDAYRALESDGELWIVANRHLNYHIALKKRFSHSTTVASNKKFVILRAVK